MTATARTATQVRGSVGATVISVMPPVQYRDSADWDREYLVSIAGSGSRDARDLCGRPDLVAAICDEFGILNADVNMYRSQRDGARQRVEKMDALLKLNYKLEDDIATERNRHQVTMLERETARGELEDMQVQLVAERAERVRLQELAAKLSAQLAELRHLRTTGRPGGNGPSDGDRDAKCKCVCCSDGGCHCLDYAHAERCDCEPCAEVIGKARSAALALSAQAGEDAHNQERIKWGLSPIVTYVRGQSLVFDTTADTTVVDVVIP